MTGYTWRWCQYLGTSLRVAGHDLKKQHGNKKGKNYGLKEKLENKQKKNWPRVHERVGNGRNFLHFFTWYQDTLSRLLSHWYHISTAAAFLLLSHIKSTGQGSVLVDLVDLWVGKGLAKSTIHLAVFSLLAAFVLFTVWYPEEGRREISYNT